MIRGFLSTCLVVTIAAAAPGAPHIVGPTEPVEPSHLAWLTIEGLEEGETATFIPRAFLQINPLYIVPHCAAFWAPDPGEYEVSAIAVRLVIDWDERIAYTVLTPLSFTVTVTGEKPPDPDPKPTGKRQVAFFHNAMALDDLTEAQQDLLSSLVFFDEIEAAGHKLVGILDVDSVGPSGAVPERWQPWYAAIKNDPVPRIALAPIGGGDIIDYPLPADEAAFWKLLKGET